jgi:hypothetical protein
MLPAPTGYGEPPQQVVTKRGDLLHVPVSAGLVYRLAKAPAYLFLPAGLPLAEARAMLMAAARVDG